MKERDGNALFVIVGQGTVSSPWLKWIDNTSIGLEAVFLSATLIIIPTLKIKSSPRTGPDHSVLVQPQREYTRDLKDL